MKVVFKNGRKVLKKTTDLSVSFLPLVLKNFERIICKQLTNVFDNILSKYQRGFRKGHGTQHCLLLVWEKWRKAVDNNETFGAFLTDLSKALDCF